MYLTVEPDLAYSVINQNQSLFNNYQLDFCTGVNDKYHQWRIPVYIITRFERWHIYSSRQTHLFKFVQSLCFALYIEYGCRPILYLTFHILYEMAALNEFSRTAQSDHPVEYISWSQRIGGTLWWWTLVQVQLHSQTCVFRITCFQERIITCLEGPFMLLYKVVAFDRQTNPDMITCQ